MTKVLICIFVFHSHFTFHDCSFGKMCYSVHRLALKPATQRPLTALANYKLIEDCGDEGTKSWKVDSACCTGPYKFSLECMIISLTTSIDAGFSISFCLRIQNQMKLKANDQAEVWNIWTTRNSHKLSQQVLWDGIVSQEPLVFHACAWTAGNCSRAHFGRARAEAVAVVGMHVTRVAFECRMGGHRSSRVPRAASPAG